MEFFFTNFLEFAIVALFLALFFKESLASFINAKLGVEEKTPEWAKSLQLYFNHDTTSHHNETHQKLDELKEISRETNRTLSEIKTYGIVCRDK